MATTSEVKAGLDEVASVIRAQRDVMIKVKSNAALASQTLAGLPAQYQAIVDQINAYSASTTNTFELLAKAELAALTSEFQALKAVADNVAAIDLG